MEMGVKVKMKIKEVRRSKGMSAERFAKEAGIRRGSLFKYESGFSSPKLDVLLKMAAILGVDERELYEVTKKGDADRS